MKGIFYSIITVFLILPIIFFSISYSNAESAKAKNVVVSTLGDKLANYASSINDDLPRAGKITFQRSVQSALVYIDTTGKPLDDAQLRLVEVMVNGTLNGTPTSQGFTLESWRSQLEQKGTSFGFATSIKIINVSVTPLDYFNIRVNITVFVNASENRRAMKLERVLTASIPIDINTFEDPLYSLKTNGVLKKTVTPPNVTIFGVTNLDNAVTNRFYMPSANGPSYLDRLEGRTAQSGKYSGPVGLESIVNFAELQANGLPVDVSRSSIDYLYFDPSFTQGRLVNQSSYAWLRLDNAHGPVYGVTLI